MDIDQFRLDFPEFSNLVKYPNSQITFWSTFAESQLDVCKWGDTKVYAVKLYTAHEITLAGQNVASANVGGAPGQQGGIANSKTVGGASVSYDATTVSEKDAGFWNLTNYGRQFYRLLKIYGAGAIQL